MPYRYKETREKVKAKYKTIYISEELEQKVNEIAKENNTSFNNVIISMIEHSLNEE